MPLPPAVQKIYDARRTLHESTKGALWHARVRHRITQLQERGLLTITWDADSDFDPKEYSSGMPPHAANKFINDCSRGRWEVWSLVLTLRPSPNSEEEHDRESLSWIVLPAFARTRSHLFATREERHRYEEELASGLLDFWYYDPDPLVRMCNEHQWKTGRQKK